MAESTVEICIPMTGSLLDLPAEPLKRELGELAYDAAMALKEKNDDG